MKRFWTRRDGMSDLETRLRDERPRPGEDLVLRVSRETSRSGRAIPRFRLGVATGLTGIALAAVFALGGLSAPIDTAARIVQFDNANGSSQAGHGKPAKVQYEEKVTICHRPPGNPSNGQTLTLSPSGAQNHLSNHPGDTRGPCPSPNKGLEQVAATGGSGSGSGSGSGDSGSSLPFTGFLAIPLLLGGVALAGTGFVLRRRASEHDSA